MSSTGWLIAPAGALLVALVVYGTGYAIRRAAYKHFTILEELRTAGEPRPAPKLQKRVVICGGRCVFAVAFTARAP
jgi:hypothetical protein